MISGGDVVEQLESTFPKRSANRVVEGNKRRQATMTSCCFARLTQARYLLTATAVIRGSLGANWSINAEAVAARGQEGRRLVFFERWKASDEYDTCHG